MLVISRPWEGDGSISPQVSVPTDVGTGLGDSTAVAGPEPGGEGGSGGTGPSLASAQVAPSGGNSSASSPVTAPKVVPGDASAISKRVAVGRQAPAYDPAPAPTPQPQPKAPKAKPKPKPKPKPAAPVVVANPPATSEPAAPPPAAPAGPRLVANFENGLTGWSTSVLGDTVPRVVGGTVRDGTKSGVVRLTGSQSRSQLVLGGDGGFGGAVQIRDGDEFAFAFSFYVERMAYGAPGADNLLMQLRSDGSEDLIFGLQLWDYTIENGGRGLWSSGEAVDGDRFLGSIADKTWHDVIVHFKASSQAAGQYGIYLDGQLVDARDAISLIDAESEFAQIEVGLFRDADLVQGTSEIRIDAAKFGDTLESVLP